MYVFEDGAVYYGPKPPRAELLKKCVKVNKLPNIPAVDGKIGYHYADLATKTVKIGYNDAPGEEPATANTETEQTPPPKNTRARKKKVVEAAETPARDATE